MRGNVIRNVLLRYRMIISFISKLNLEKKYEKCIATIEGQRIALLNRVDFKKSGFDIVVCGGQQMPQ